MSEKEEKRQRMRDIIHNYYHSYLIHFLLGISGCTVLFLLLMRFTFVTEDALLATHLSKKSGLSPSVTRSFSCILFEGTIYSPTLGGYQSVFASSKDLEQSSIVQRGMQLLQNVQSRITEAPLPTDEEKAALYAYDPNAAKEGEVLIVPTDLSLSARHTDENQGILFSNRTEYVLNGAELLQKPYPLTHKSPGSEKEPLVLIIHTHGTESFAKEGAQAQSEHTSTRSTDIRENIVSVGAVLAATLREAGIGVIHCETMFDKDSYNDSYVASLAYVKEMLAAYPSITYVLDVHRDALESGDGAIMRPVTYVGNTVSAQVMLVVGTDAGGGNHPDWEKHLTIAAHLQKRLNDAYPSLARPINVRDATFNAQYAKGSLLIEIGASGNSLREAENAAYYLGVQLAKLICDNVSS